MDDRFLMGFLLIGLLITSTTLFAQQGTSSKMDWQAQASIEITGFFERFTRNDAALSFRQAKVSLRAQHTQGLSDVQLKSGPATPPSAIREFFFRDNFERDFPAQRWQILNSAANAGWEKVSDNAVVGSYCLRSGGTTDGAPASSSPHLRWLVAGPFDCSEVANPTLSFYLSLLSQKTSIFFAGFSPDGDTFHGVTTSGETAGWQLVNLRANDIRTANIPGAPRVWVGFLHASTTPNDLVNLDRITFVASSGWSEEYAGTRNGKFDPNLYTGGIGLARPAFVDIDGDGDLDVVTGEYDGALNFFRNDGSRSRPHWRFIDGAFADIDVGESSAPAFADFDDDGDMDLVIGNYNGNLQLYLNNDGVWTFSGYLNNELNQPIKDGGLAAPTFVDIDDDADLDLFVGNIDGALIQHRNINNARQPVWEAGGGPYFGIDIGTLAAPAWADIDNDGDLDLFVGNQRNTLNFYQNDGSRKEAHFEENTAAFDSITVTAVTAPAFADIDFDKDQDLLIGQADGSLTFLRNQGTPEKWHFEAEAAVEADMLDVGFQSLPAFADWDADGDLDMMLTAHDGKIMMLRNDGGVREPDWVKDDGFFDDLDAVRWLMPAAVDIDKDGDMDLFNGARSGTLDFIRNDGDKFQPKFNIVPAESDSIRITGNMVFPAFGDLDADGDFDLLLGTTGAGIHFYENTGSAARPIWRLQKANMLSTAKDFRTVPVLADMDFDGDLDLFVGLNDGIMRFYENTGTRREAKWRLASLKYLAIETRLFAAPALADIDSDGDLDLFLGNNSGGLFFWRNLSRDGSFVEAAPDPVRRFRVWENESLKVAIHSGKTGEIHFRLHQSQPVLVEINSLDGRLVRSMENGLQSAGAHRLSWDGKNAEGVSQPAGIYLIKCKFGPQTSIRKLLLLNNPT